MSKKTSISRKPGFWKMHLTSSVSMSMVLLLVGLIVLLLFLAKDMSMYVRENINLSIILSDTKEKHDEQRILNYLKASPYVKSVAYISKEDALKDHISSIGENPEEFLGYNPLMASLEVKLNANYANTDSVKMIESKLKSFENISRINYQKDMITLVNDNVRKISLILIGLTFVLLFVSVTLINNTIRLSLYSNRFLINTMKLVGATSWFIKKPYVLSSMVNGLLASLLSLLLLLGVIIFVEFEFGLPTLMISPLTAFAVSVIVILTGVGIAALSAFLSVGRYLKLDTHDMYFI